MILLRWVLYAFADENAADLILLDDTKTPRLPPAPFWEKYGITSDEILVFASLGICALIGYVLVRRLRANRA